MCLESINTIKITIRSGFQNFENKKQILRISGNLLPITIVGGGFPPTPNTPYYYPGGVVLHQQNSILNFTNLVDSSKVKFDQNA